MMSWHEQNEVNHKRGFSATDEFRVIRFVIQVPNTKVFSACKFLQASYCPFQTFTWLHHDIAKNVRNSAVADKSHDAFVQMQWRS